MKSQEPADRSSSEEVRKDVELAGAIADHLMRSPTLAAVLRRRGEGSISDEAWEIGTGLADIRQSSVHLFDHLVPKLLRTEPTSAEVEEILHEIGEEYRHILYHITNTKFFNYVVTE